MITMSFFRILELKQHGLLLGVDKMLAPTEGVTKAQRALCNIVVNNPDPAQAVQVAERYDTLEAAEKPEHVRHFDYIIETDEQDNPVTRYTRVVFPRRILSDEEYQARKEQSAYDRWHATPLTEWPKTLTQSIEDAKAKLLDSYT
jgi:hypothetical protein